MEKKGRKRLGMIANGHKAFWGSDEMTLKLENDDGCTSLHIYCQLLNCKLLMGELYGVN